MSEQGQMQEFFLGGCWAVVGVSQDASKYGSQVHGRLKRRGEQVYPVNPREGEIRGETCYPDLASLPEGVSQIVLVVPPKSTEQVVVDAVACGISRVWMQPGSESKAAVEYCRAHGVNVVSGHCILHYMDELDYRI